MFKRTLVLGTAALLAAGCGAHDLAGPERGQQSVLRAGQLIPVSPILTFIDSGDTAAQAPVVRVTDANSTPIAGVLVTFTITAGGGTVERKSAMSDLNGLASVGSWHLGQAPGTNTLIASVTGLPPVTFTARFRAVVIATYDLRTIGGQPVPLTFPWGWTITAGHYVLFNDGSCTFGYEGSNAAPPVNLSYVQLGPSTILFYQLPGTYPNSSFYAQRNGLLSTGTLNDSTLTVIYEDSEDFVNPEVYVRRRN
jgi:hypothetical protein